MIIYRYSHGGAVCAGDYAEYTNKNNSDEIKNLAYYMMSEGSFFKIYSIIIFSMIGLACCIGICALSTAVVGVGFQSSTNIDNFVRHMDPLEEIMRKMQEKKYQEAAAKAGYGNAGNADNEAGPKEEDVRNEFKSD